MTANLIGGLSEQVGEKINKVFATYPQIKKAILYGSRAKGNYKKGSDIDLTLYGEDLTYELYSQIVDDLDELFLPYMIDLSIYHKLKNVELVDHIDRVGKVFYARK